MSDAQKVVLVTGAHKGIGLEVVRQLAARGARVFLTARKRAAGEAAVASLKSDVHFLPLDVDDFASVESAVRALAKQTDHLDVLVNNAAILLDDGGSVLGLSGETALKTFATNTVGPLLVTQAFQPLLAQSQTPRVINVSSGAGQLADGLQNWAPAYSLSKTALNALTQHFAAELPKFAINAVSPGWVRTDMGGDAAPLSVEQGADTIVWLALDAPQSLTGKFLRERREMPGEPLSRDQPLPAFIQNIMTTTITNDALLAQLHWRYATKTFNPTKKISADDWAALEQALVLTPTSYGFQPYRFVVVTDQATKEKFVPHSWNQKQPADSSHFVVFAAKETVNEADVDHYLARVAEVRGAPVASLDFFKKMLVGDIVQGPRSQQQFEWATRQAYIALGNFMTAAALVGIDTCPMEGIDPVKYDEILGLPAKGYRTVVACAAGYRAADDKYAAAPKVRFPAEELIIHV